MTFSWPPRPRSRSHAPPQTAASDHGPDRPGPASRHHCQALRCPSIATRTRQAVGCGAPGKKVPEQTGRATGAQWLLWLLWTRSRPSFKTVCQPLAQRHACRVSRVACRVSRLASRVSRLASRVSRAHSSAATIIGLPTSNGRAPSSPRADPASPPAAPARRSAGATRSCSRRGTCRLFAISGHWATTAWKSPFRKRHLLATFVDQAQGIAVACHLLLGSPLWRGSLENQRLAPVRQNSHTFQAVRGRACDRTRPRLTPPYRGSACSSPSSSR